MAKTAVISARIDPELKRNAEQIFRELGLTASQAITLFYKQVDLQRGLPFSIRIPNEVTRKALEDARARRDLESFDSVEELFEDLKLMRTIRRTSQFKRDVKRMKKRGKDLSKLKEVLEKITRGQELEAKYRDHVLVGQY